MSDDRLLMTLMLGMAEGKRQPGRHARKWIDDTLMWCGQDIKRVKAITEDRDKWRTLVASLYGPQDHRKRKITYTYLFETSVE